MDTILFTVLLRNTLRWKAFYCRNNRMNQLKIENHHYSNNHFDLSIRLLRAWDSWIVKRFALSAIEVFFFLNKHIILFIFNEAITLHNRSTTTKKVHFEMGSLQFVWENKLKIMDINLKGKKTHTPLSDDLNQIKNDTIVLCFYFQ